MEEVRPLCLALSHWGTTRKVCLAGEEQGPALGQRWQARALAGGLCVGQWWPRGSLCGTGGLAVVLHWVPAVCGCVQPGEVLWVIRGWYLHIISYHILSCIILYYHILSYIICSVAAALWGAECAAMGSGVSRLPELLLPLCLSKAAVREKVADAVCPAGPAAHRHSPALGQPAEIVASQRLSSPVWEAGGAVLLCQGAVLTCSSKEPQAWLCWSTGGITTRYKYRPLVEKDYIFLWNNKI